MRLPNFLVIGAAKSGTSALYRYLRQHPQIFLSARKESHFFAYEGRDPHTQGPGDTIPNAITQLADYAALFASAGAQQTVGEVCPTYILFPHACERIRFHVPDARLIAILRRPADRAYSAYMHLVRDGREPIADFGKALDAEPERIAANWGPIWHYSDGGFYAEQLARYRASFAPEQLKIILYDDFQRWPIDVVQELCRFIGVDDAFVPDMSVRPNVSGQPKNRFLQRAMFSLFNRPNPVRALARQMISEETRTRFTSSMRRRNLRKTGMESATRQRLNDLYRHDVERLEEMIGRDLSHWLADE